MLITFSGMVGSGKSTNAKKVLELLRDEGLAPCYLRFRFLRWRHVILGPAEQPKHSSAGGKRRASAKTPAIRNQKATARTTSLDKSVYHAESFRAVLSNRAKTQRSSECAKKPHQSSFSWRSCAPYRLCVRLLDTGFTRYGSVQPDRRRSSLVRTLTIGRFLVYFIRALKLRLVLHYHFDNRLAVLDRYFYDNLAHCRLATSTEKRLARLLAAAMPQPDLALVMLVSPETAQQRRPIYSLRALERLGGGYDRLLRCLPGLTAISTGDLTTLDERVTEVVTAWLRTKNVGPMT